MVTNGMVRPITRVHMLASRSTSHLHYKTNQGFETLHKQWVSLLTVQHPIYCTERVSKIWPFVCHLGVDLSEK